MMRIEYEDEILKPPEIVFPWIADPEKAMKWQKNVQGGEIIDNKQEIIGTTFKEVIEENGNTLEMEGKITRFENDKLIGFHLVSKIHEFDVSYSLKEVERGTKITIKAIINWKFPMNIVYFFMRNKMESGLVEQLRSEIDELKKVIDSE